MDKWLDKPEGDAQKTEYDDELYRNFRKSSEEVDIKEQQRQSAFGTKFQGDVGEGITIRGVSERQGLTPDPYFDQPPHGFDCLYRDKQGDLVVVESKLAEKGIKALDGDQMQVEWVERNAKLMQDSDSEQYTPGNSKLGAEIIQIGSENVRRLVVVTDPSTLEAKVYEGQEDRTWKQIDSFSVYDLEQPTLS